MVMGSTFINMTNHPSCRWSDEQLDAARQYGHIVDIPFPAVDPTVGPEEIALMADTYIEKIRAFEDPTVLVQGEFTLVYAVVTRLKAEGISALAACSERDVVEIKSDDGTTVQKSVFRFRRFREYA